MALAKTLVPWAGWVEENEITETSCREIQSIDPWFLEDSLDVCGFDMDMFGRMRISCRRREARIQRGPAKLLVWRINEVPLLPVSDRDGMNRRR